MKKAFTMIELIIVIIILGIVSSIGAEIIVSMYENYIRTRTINNLETKSEAALEQLTKRFQYRIKDSTIGRKKATPADVMSVSNSNINFDYNVLEWIGYSNESFIGTPTPGWSGFIDFDNVQTSKVAKTLKTPDSNLSYANNVILSLSNATSAINDPAGDVVIIFKKPWNFDSFGWGNPNVDGDAPLRIQRTADDVLTIVDSNISEIYEQYWLAHSAYGIVPEGNIAGTDFNLTLRYNYRPWLGESYGVGDSSVLAEHVNLFTFKQDLSVIRFKLCLHDNNESGIGERIVVCKERAVY